MTDILNEDTIRKWKTDVLVKHGSDLKFSKHNGGYSGHITVARKNDTIVGSFQHKDNIGHIMDTLKEEQIDENESYFFGNRSYDRFKAGADAIYGAGNWKAGKVDSFGSHMFHHKNGDRIGRFAIDGEGDRTHTLFHKPRPVPKGVKEEVESLDELSMDTVKSYKEKVSKNPAPSRTTSDILHKAIRRFAGKERAEDRIHHGEMVKMRARLGIKEETLDEGTAHYSAKNGSNTYHLAVTKDGATVTNQHGVVLHPSSIYGKANGLTAVNNVHNTVVSNLRRGTKSGKDTAENTLKKYSHFNWESQNSTNEETVDEGRFLKPKTEKSPKSTATMSLNQLLKNKKENPGQSPFKTQDDKVKKYLGEVEETLDEGLVDSIKHGIKSVKRGMQGWDKNAVGPNGEKLGEPKAVVDRVKSRTDDELKSIKDTFTDPKNTFVTRNTSFDNPTKHSPAGLQKRVLDCEMKKRGLTSEETLDEVVKTEKPGHKVGDTVFTTSPTNKALTMTGKVTKIGQTLTTVKHKDGSEAHYPHKLVGKEYSDLHTDPAKKYKQFQREHLEQTGELLTLTEVKYMIENANGGAGAIAQHGGIDGQAPANTGKAKKMMGNKASVDAIVKIITKGSEPN